MSTSILEPTPIDRLGSLQPVDDEIRTRLQARLEDLLPDSRPVRVLDAGCGHRRPVPIADDLHVTGIDIEAAQLRPDLDEAIVADLQTYDLGRSRFDVIVCWYVLEHIADPVKVIEKFVDALRPGGVLILAVPHVSSIKGLVTKYSPQWFHDWMWSRVFGAGTEHEAFPTVLSRSLTPRALRRLAAADGLSVEFLAQYEAWPQKRVRGKLRIKGRTFAALASLVRLLSFDTLTIAFTDMVMVVRKPE
jgi:SAM-dependent methyltransferase